MKCILSFAATAATSWPTLTFVPQIHMHPALLSLQVLVTTSRDPSSTLTTFAKEVALLIPGAKTQNRGTSIVSDLVDSCRSSSVTDIIVLHENRCVSHTIR